MYTRTATMIHGTSLFTTARTPVNFPFSTTSLKVCAFLALIPFLFFTLVVALPAPLTLLGLLVLLAKAAGIVAAIWGVYQAVRAVLNALNDSLSDVSEEIRIKRVEYNNLSTEKRNLESALVGPRAEYENKLASVQSAQDQIDAFQASIDRVDEQLRTASEAGEREQLNRERERYVDAKREWYSKKQRRLTDANRYWRLTIRPKENRIGEINVRHSAILREVSPLRTELEQLRNVEIPAAETAVENAHTDYQNAVDDFNEIQRQIDNWPGD